MDRRLLLDLNHLTRLSSVLNDAIRSYAEVVGPALLVACVVHLVITTRQGGIGRSEGPRAAGAVVAALSGPLAYGAARLADSLVASNAPGGPGVVALFHEGAHSMPDPLTAAAFAVTGALAFGRAHRVALIAVAASLLEAFAVLAAGAAWPSDVAVGAAGGLLLAAVLTALRVLLAQRSARTEPAGAHHRVLGVQQGRSALDGPAAHRPSENGTGSVRILSTGVVRPAIAPGAPTDEPPVSRVPSS